MSESLREPSQRLPPNLRAQRESEPFVGTSAVTSAMWRVGIVSRANS